MTTGPRSAEPSASDSPSPPSTPRAYYALLGAHRAGLADWATIQRCASRFPTHAGLGPDRATHANQMRPLPGDQWLDLDDTAAAELGGRSPTGTRPALLLDLVERLVAFLAAHAPPGQLAVTRGAEAILARACVVLTACESAYRDGHLPAADAGRWADPTATAPELLDAVPDHQVAELIDLITRAHAAGLLARLATPPPTLRHPPVRASLALSSSTTGPTVTFSSHPHPTTTAFLDDIDRALIEPKRREHNKLGFAVQLATVRYVVESCG